MPSNLPVIPQNITVHLGAPSQSARNVTVPFVDYIKNVASSEIYPTWPENSLRANIYAIISFALNRVYTEWYRSRGYDFDITNTTQFDQAFSENREIYENISVIVDDIFNDYVVRQGFVEPYFTQFCNGTTSTCAGLSQWGTVDLAEQGLSPFEILRRYYGDDIGIVNDAPVQFVTESYPGFEVVRGDNSNAVKIIQEQLNRISRNYPAIPEIESENGVFGGDTEAAVRKFQEIFNLPATGRVDKSTWYRIKQYYVGVKSLSELVSEGITAEEARLPFVTELSIGVTGDEVRALQYYLNVIAYFNPSLNLTATNGVYNEDTASAVRAFQTFYGLNPTGSVDAETWETLERIYDEILRTLGEGYAGSLAKLYPGRALSFGDKGEDVTDLQGYLQLIGKYYTEIPEIEITGTFDEQTRNAVEVFQTLFGLTPTGAVGPNTWNAIAGQYNFLVTTEG